MTKEFANLLFSQRNTLGVPFREVPEAEARNLDANTGAYGTIKDFYFGTLDIDPSSSTHKYYTLDIEAYKAVENDIKLLLQMENTDNIRRIKNYVLFFVVITSVSLLLSLIVAIGS